MTSSTHAEERAAHDIVSAELRIEQEHVDRVYAELRITARDSIHQSPFAIAAVAFLGVGREGLESALFFYATVESAGETGIAPALGWVVGKARWLSHGNAATDPARTLSNGMPTSETS